MFKPRAVGLMLCLSTLLLAGCGNKEKAELAISIDAATRHPELVRAIERLELAGLIAALDLNAPAAKELHEWSLAHGQAVRAEIDRQLAAIQAMVPQLRVAGDELLAKRLSAEVDQEALLQNRLGEQKALVDEQQPVEVDELIAAHSESLAPLAAKLTDRQQLVVLGHWQSVIKGLGELTQLGPDAAEEDIASKREALASTLLEARGHGFLPDEAVAAKARKLVDAVPLSLQPPAFEGQAKRLFAAFPPDDAEQQAKNATETLATLLCQGPAPELLAQVK
ncbi:MAG: hypothetical protein HUU35_18275 [Armatimonadetes bacterium]|nr:hypothetical protein [Armatimonadota bacterium]